MTGPSLQAIRRVLLLLMGVLAFAGTSTAREAEIRVMTFNVWGADDTASGRRLIADAILQSGADIVGFQEMTGPALRSIAQSLGYYYYDQGMGSEAILSRYRVLDVSLLRYGVQVELSPGHPAWIYNTHLYHAPYGPYQLNGIAYNGGRLYDPNTADGITRVIADQKSARGNEVNQIIRSLDAAGALKSGDPVFLTGDFNEPTHLDWTARARDAGVHVAEVAWPTSVAVSNLGFRDSYREVFPDEVAMQGRTWSPVYPATYMNPGDNRQQQPVPKPEPQDRIDFVYYAGAEVQSVGAWRSGPVGRDEVEDLELTGYPSDHNAVTSAFRVSGLEQTKLDFRALGEENAVLPTTYGQRALSSPSIEVQYATEGPADRQSAWRITNGIGGVRGGAVLSPGNLAYYDGTLVFDLKLQSVDDDHVSLLGFTLRDRTGPESEGHRVRWEVLADGEALDAGVVLVPDQGAWQSLLPRDGLEGRDVTLRLWPLAGVADHLILDDVVFRQVTVPEPSSSILLGSLLASLWPFRRRVTTHDAVSRSLSRP